MAQQYHYRMNVYWSKPDNLWLVDIPELPGAMADGETPEEAVANAQVIISEWVETAQKYGRPVPEPQDVPASA
jgi:predicted RNase H-like HicB family nuclease